jgi:DinB superfamily
MGMKMGSTLAIALEIGARRTFASALDWPGWSRSGRDETGAIGALLAHASRYADALAAGGVPFVVDLAGTQVVVGERLRGGSGTDFGALSVPPSADAAPLAEEELAHHVALLRAAWAALDAAATRHAADELRKGPRGGGRDLARIVTHVREADEAYLHQLGARPPKGGPEPAADMAANTADQDPMAALRVAAVAALRARALGLPIEAPTRVSRPWSPRWYVRRAAWHALDHAWEIEDRAITPDETGGD